MIDNIIGGNEFLYVNTSNGYTPYTNPTQLMSGMVRFNNNRMEVYDGNSWMPIHGGSASIHLSSEATDAIKWARDKMQLEAKAQALAKTNPTVADALANVQAATDQLQVIMTLVQE